jgi:CRISPR/Cas system-associated exonuclease Cas4 (RecB family)
MPLNPSIMDLPRSNRPGGNPPSKNNFVAEAVAQRWYERSESEAARGDLALAIPEAGPYRGSYASKRCDRALWYSMKGIPASNPPGLADAWRFGMGHTVHEMLQKIVAELFEGAEVEKIIDLRAIDIPGSAHADLVINYEGERTLIEIKSINGFGFKMSATPFKGPAEGPRSGHVIQAALAAKAEGCTRVVIAYLSLEVVGAQLAADYSDSEAGRFAAEWHYTVEELEPIIAAETERISYLMRSLDADKPIPRRLVDHGIPEGALITDPSSGMWVVTEGRAIHDTGDTWMCAYCDFRDRCLEDGA